MSFPIELFLNLASIFGIQSNYFCVASYLCVKYLYQRDENDSTTGADIQTKHEVLTTSNLKSSKAIQICHNISMQRIIVIKTL